MFETPASIIYQVHIVKCFSDDYKDKKISIVPQLKYDFGGPGAKHIKEIKSLKRSKLVMKSLTVFLLILDLTT